MIRKSLIALIFVALLGITLSQVNSADAKNISASAKPTSPKIHPTPKPKPTSPQHGSSSNGTTLTGTSRIFNLN